MERFERKKFRERQEKKKRERRRAKSKCPILLRFWLISKAPILQNGIKLTIPNDPKLALSDKKESPYKKKFSKEYLAKLKSIEHRDFLEVNVFFKFQELILIETRNDNSKNQG